MSNFGKAVKIIRIKRDSKAKDFAEFVGYASAHYVSDIECGIKRKKKEVLCNTNTEVKEYL